MKKSNRFRRDRMREGTSLRKAASTGWNLWRAFIGLAYLVAAAFNLFFTLPKGDLSWFADNAWHPALALLVRNTVVPYSGFFVTLVVVFETAIGTLMLSHGRMVDIGVAASVLWVVFLIPFLQPFPMAATNVVLAVLQGILLLRRYETPIWHVAGK